MLQQNVCLTNNYKVMKQSKLTHGSLFSGIGGFELGAEMAGIDTLLWNCEKRNIFKVKY